MAERALEKRIGIGPSVAQIRLPIPIGTVKEGQTLVIDSRKPGKPEWRSLVAHRISVHLGVNGHVREIDTRKPAGFEVRQYEEKNIQDLKIRLAPFVYVTFTFRNGTQLRHR